MPLSNVGVVARAALLAVAACTPGSTSETAATVDATLPAADERRDEATEPVGNAASIPTRETDYAVYSVLFRDPDLTAPYLGQKNDYWVVEARTAEPLPMDVVNRSESLRVHDFWMGARDDYLKHQQEVLALDAASLSTELPVTLISQADLDRWNAGDSFWTDFWREHPTGGGIYTLSRVGYGEDGTHAFVQFDRSAGGEDGTTWDVYLELRDGAWNIGHKVCAQSR